MRTHSQLFKSIVLTTLFYTGFAAGGIAQDVNPIVNPEAEAPVILSTTPSGGEMNVELGNSIEITFSSEMDENSINSNTLLLHAAYADTMYEEHSEEMLDDQIKERSEKKDSNNSWQNTSGNVSGTINYSNKIAVFTPDEELKEGTLYTFTVTTGVKNSENVALENDRNWSFTTTGTSESTYSDRQNAEFGMEEKSDSSYTNNQNEKYGWADTSDSTYIDKLNEKTGWKSKSDTAYTDMKNIKHDMMEKSDSTYSDKQNKKSDLDRKNYSENTADFIQKAEKNMIDLGKAGQFVILAKTGINNKSDSRITGHTGDGSVNDSTKTEKDYSDTEQQTTSEQTTVLQSIQSDTTAPDVSEAIEDMMSAYSDVSIQNSDDVTSHNNDRFNSSALPPGVHEWSNSLNIESDFTLSGSTDDVWIMMVGGDLTIDENTVFTLIGNTQADNVYWYVEGEVTIGENAIFEGVILSMDEITLEKGATFNGRMFSQTSINLDDNTISEPGIIAGQRTSRNR